jgi:hypothetical protein
MATVDWSAIYLGNIADMDTDESTLAGEGAAALLTTYGSAASPLSDNVITLTTTSTNNVMERDNVATSDQLTFEVSPGGPTTSTMIDSIYRVDVNISYSTTSGANVGGFTYVIQDTDGNLFFVVDEFVGFFVPSLFTEPIEEIVITDIEDDDVSFLLQFDHDSYDFTSTSAGPTICFLDGTRIRTPQGDKAVEALRVGDLVETLDHGPLPILWLGRRAMNFPMHDAKYKPYCITKGGLGRATPARDLKLSRQHRVLLEAPGDQVLAPVCGLDDLPGVGRMTQLRQAVFHSILLPRHSILFAEGAKVESFYPGPTALRCLPRSDRRALCQLFDGLSDSPEQAYGRLARRALTRRDAQRFVKRCVAPA